MSSKFADIPNVLTMDFKERNRRIVRVYLEYHEKHKVRSCCYMITCTISHVYVGFEAKKQARVVHVSLALFRYPREYSSLLKLKIPLH